MTNVPFLNSITNEMQKRKLKSDVVANALLDISIGNEKLDDVLSIKSSASEIDGSVNLAHPSLNSFLLQVLEETRNIQILVNSDSTGNSTDEWVYYFAEWLAVKYPTYSVKLAYWDDTVEDYSSLLNISTGTGTYTITIWNFANAGKQAYYALSPTKVDKAIVNKLDNGLIDLCINNHGHNADLTSRDSSKALKYLIFSEWLFNMCPNISFLQVRQNPTRDDNSNIKEIRSAVDFAKMRNICVANVWDKFINLNKDTSLYEDNVHPSRTLGTVASPTGTRLFLEAIVEQLDKKSNFSFYSTESFLNKVGYSIYKNPHLLDLDANNIPIGMEASNVICTKDTAVFVDRKKGYSTKVSALTTGVVGTLTLKFDSELVDKIGKTFTLAIRMKTNPSVSNTYGRVSFITTDDTKQDLAFTYLNGDWHWRFFTVRLRKTSNNQFLRALIYINSSAAETISGDSLWIDRMVVVEGGTPCCASIL